MMDSKPCAEIYLPIGLSCHLCHVLHVTLSSQCLPYYTVRIRDMGEAP